MTPSEDTAEESIFEEALSLASHAEREEFLSKACDGRPELLISVKSLLAAYSDGEILERTLLPVAVTKSLHTADLSGIKIGPYLLRQLIGHGGMGAVYLAEQQQPIQRKVALKIVRPERCSHDALRRFQVEQQSLARLDHPHIAQVLDASVTNSGISYFAMELVDGLPILACCEKHSLSIPDRLRLMVQCCQAIQHAHQRSIIHRDIKPSNVLVTLHEGSWFVKVIDFGIAKAFSETESDDLNSTSNTATQFGVFLGTPLYMSPEQASMGSVAIDPRADIYSLGALFYSVLTGLPPYDPGRFRTLRLDEVRLIISDEDPVLPSARVRHKISSSDSTSTDVSENRRLALQLSGDLDCVVMKAMQKDRDQRYQTVAELIEDLQRVLDHRPVKARAPTLIYRLTRFARRNRRALVNIGIAAACLSVALAVAIIQSRRVSLAEQRTLAERSQKDRAENEKTQSQYAADLRLALSATLSNDPGAANTILNKYVPAEGATDQRSFDWYFLAGRNTVNTSELLKAEKSLYYLCRINQGSLIACCGAEGIVRILDETTGTLLHTIDAGQGEVNGLASSPDGSTLASAGDDGTIALWDVATGVAKARFRAHQKQAFQVAWSPDGQRLATCGNEQNVRIWSATDLKEICVIPSAERDLECLAVSVNGDLAFGTEGGFVILTKMPGESGQQSGIQTFSDGSNEHCGAVAFSPDGRYLAAGRKDGRVVLRAIGPSVWTQPRELLFHDSVSSLSFSPAGDWLAAGIHDGSVSLVELTDLQHEGYRLTLREGITDLAGNLLDGDGDGTAGGNLPIEWIDAADRSPFNAPDGVPDEDGRPLRLLRCDPLPANGLLPPGTKTVTLEFSEAVANADKLDLYQFRIAGDSNMPTDDVSFHPTDVQVRNAIVTLSVPEVPGHPDVKKNS